MRVWLDFKCKKKGSSCQVNRNTGWMDVGSRYDGCARLIKNSLCLVLSPAGHKMILSLKSKSPVLCSFSGQSIRSPGWILIGCRPVDTQLLAAHIKGLRGWKKKKKRKSQIFRQTLGFLIVESADGRTVVDCSAVIESSIHAHVTAQQAASRSQTKTQIYASKRDHTCEPPEGAHYCDWLRDLLLIGTLFRVTFAS